MATATYTVTGTTPNAAGTAQVGSSAFTGLDYFSTVTIVGQLQGATGGTLNLYIQSSLDGVIWYDVVAYAQLAAGAAALRNVVTLNRGFRGTPGITTVNAASGTPSLTANSVNADCLGTYLRLMATAGAGTSAGQTITLTIFAASEGT